MSYLVPFNTKVKVNGKDEWQLICTPIPRWSGLIEMTLRTGHVRDVVPRCVYKNEHFEVRNGLEEMLDHRPIFGPNRGELVAVYAVAYLRHGRATWEVMSKEEVEKIRGRAQSKDSPAWRNDFDEMAKKTVIRRLCKRLPQSSQLREALAIEDGLDNGEEIHASATISRAPALPQPEVRQIPPGQGNPAWSDKDVYTGEDRPNEPERIAVAQQQDAVETESQEPAAPAPVKCGECKKMVTTPETHDPECGKYADGDGGDLPLDDRRPQQGRVGIPD